MPKVWRQIEHCSYDTRDDISANLQHPKAPGWVRDTGVHGVSKARSPERFVQDSD